jgi:glyoxylase-like metal-dependent hydrolase (beta-lactamase superfamily II)
VLDDSGDDLDEAGSQGFPLAFRGAFWYSWSEQIKLMERLLDARFEWVLPGHGRPVNLFAGEMHANLECCIEWMKTR